MDASRCKFPRYEAQRFEQDLGRVFKDMVRDYYGGKIGRDFLYWFIRNMGAYGKEEAAALMKDINDFGKRRRAAPPAVGRRRAG